MTSLIVRKLDWRFDRETPFQWNPANPAFGLGMNALSFIGPAFERFIVLVVREAMRVIDDPEVRSEADAFLRQEGLHAAAHRVHVAALTAQYPGLAEVSQALDRLFDTMLENESLDDHLAYIADIEATFTPLFDTFLRHRDIFFDNGDHGVAPLFLWHFVEEIEHRASAQIIYDAVVSSPWYRLRRAPRVFSHILECVNVCGRGFNRHVPIADRLIDSPEQLGLSPRSILRQIRSSGRNAEPSAASFESLSRREGAMLLYRLLRSQRPGHSQTDEQTPPFADEWIAAYEQGRDVVNWYGAEGVGVA